jgi:hypothetical protein
VGGRGQKPETRKKLEARKKLEKRAESHLSGARFVRHTHGTPTYLIDNEHQTHLENFNHNSNFCNHQKEHDQSEHLPNEFPMK